jgi:hypothetical protein
MQELDCADVRDLAIHRRLSRIHYSRRCAEASAVKAYQKRGFSLAPGMEIGYVVKDAATWQVDTREEPRSLMLGIIGSSGKGMEEVSYALKKVIY